MSPGSQQAIKNGCTCAELDNIAGGEFYWIEAACPLHGESVRKADEFKCSESEGAEKEAA